MKCERDTAAAFKKIISDEETKESKPKKVRMSQLLT
jgi:hypothetical protein